jgi:SPP1 family phage portal protein
MTTEQLYSFLQSGQIDKVKELFQIGYDIDVIERAIKQYDPKQHDVHDPAKRKDRPIYKEGTTLDENGVPNKVLDDIKNVQRISAPYQKQIVLLRSAFIGSPKMASNPQQDIEKDLIKVIDKIWHDNKLDFRFMETKKRTMSELRCAWLFYNVEDKEYWLDQPIISNLKPKVKILSHLLGDALYPIYDVNDDLTAFARAYETVSYDDNMQQVKNEHLDVYTSERFYFKKKVSGKWQDNFFPGVPLFSEGEGEFTTTYQKNITGKIPIIYFSQPEPEWSDVQDACTRLDELISNHADTNDYFGNPILFGKGDTLSLPQKGDAGKYVEATGDGADLKFVTWNNAPESIKMEIENLWTIVFHLSSTVKYSEFEKMGEMSGFAIQLRFLLPTLKAKDVEMSIFGEGVQRAYNYLKKLVSVLDKRYVQTISFQITPEFSSVLPTNVTEVLDNINKAMTGGILSEETGIELNLLVKDVAVEKERIKAEQEANQVNEINKQKQLAAITKPFPAAVN